MRVPHHIWCWDSVFGVLIASFDSAHRPANTPGKKGDFPGDFPFDLPEPPPYNPRPRCFAADGLEVVFTVDFQSENRQRTLFDIVILGRGTWAAARYATLEA